MSNYTAHNLTHNDGGYGYNPYAEEDAQQAAEKSEARIKHIIANIDSYKAAWSKAVAKYSVKGQLPTGALKKVEQEAGVTLGEIQTVKSRMA